MSTRQKHYQPYHFCTRSPPEVASGCKSGGIEQDRDLNSKLVHLRGKLGDQEIEPAQASLAVADQDIDQIRRNWLILI